MLGRVVGEVVCSGESSCSQRDRKRGLGEGRVPRGGRYRGSCRARAQRGGGGKKQMTFSAAGIECQSVRGVAWKSVAFWVTENRKSKAKEYENEGLRAGRDMRLKANNRQMWMRQSGVF